MRSLPLPDELYAPRMSWRPDADVPVIERFGRYDVLGCVGRGGMAEILLARETGTDTQAHPVVIKRVLPEIDNDMGVVTMFRDEARLVMALDHPNICRIYEVGQVNGRWFIAMEWIHGASLADMIEATQKAQRDPKSPVALPASAVSHIITTIAKALDYAHRAVDAQGKPLSLVHRDVSPQNIMVGFDGSIRLLDFGLARASTQTYKTEAGVVKGKLTYLAPEQWQGGELDGRADLFSLGLCLYEGLTGRALYKRDKPIETMNAVTREPPPDVRAVRPELDPRFSPVVMKALQKRPADRFADGAEMAKALSPLADVNDPRGQLRALLRTLFPSEATLGPTLGLLARLPQRPASNHPPATLPTTPPSVSVAEGNASMRPSLTVSQTAEKIRGGHRSLWITLITIALAIGGVLFAMGWRIR